MYSRVGCASAQQEDGSDVEDLEVWSETDVYVVIATCRDEAARIWQQRESEWERERQAREQLMQEVSHLPPWNSAAVT